MLKNKLYIISIIPFLVFIFSCSNRKALVLENIPVSKSEMDTTLEIYHLIKPFHDSVSLLMNDTLYWLNDDLFKGFPYNPLGYRVSEWIFDYVANHQLPVPDLVLMNNGGLRKHLKKGPVRVGDVYELMPFDNKLSYVEIDRDKFLQLLQYIREKKNMAVFGITVEYTIDGKILVDGSEKFKEKYLVLTSDYLANGGDQLSFFHQPLNREDLVILIRDALIERLEYMQQNNIKITSKYKPNVILPEP